MTDDAVWILEWAGVGQEEVKTEGQGLLLFVEAPDEKFLTKAQEVAEALTLGIKGVAVGDHGKAFLEAKGVSLFESEPIASQFPVPKSQNDTLLKIIQEVKPEICFFQKTQFTQYAVPYLAEKLGVGLAGPSLRFSFDLENRRLIQTISYYEDRLFADIICAGSPQLVIWKGV